MNRVKHTLIGIMLLSLLTPMPVLAGDTQPSNEERATLVESHAFSLGLPWFGTVESMSSVTVTALVGGQITQIHQRDESEVRQIDSLFDLGGKEVKAQRVNLTEQVEQARRMVKAASQNLGIRQQMLGEHLSNKELLNATKQALALALAQLSTATQALAMFEAAIHIKAPADGVFTARSVHLGQYVAPGAVLARVVNPQLVRIRASLFSPKQVQLAGLAATIRSSAGLDRQGIVAHIMPETSPEGGVQVWIEGDGLKGLDPGMQASGEIIAQRQSLAVPERAIALDDQGQAYVFVKTNQDFRQQRVETGLHEHGLVEVVSGLNGNEQIAVNDVYELLYRNFSKMYRAPD